MWLANFFTFFGAYTVFRIVEAVKADDIVYVEQEDVVLLITLSLFAVGGVLMRLYEISESLTEIKKTLKKIEQKKPPK